jgi:DNA-binding MarR family transcriptional regulator
MLAHGAAEVPSPASPTLPIGTRPALLSRALSSLRATWGPMHEIFFSLKRAHHGVLALGRGLLKRFKGFTPARFDMLYAIQTHGPYGLRQSQLRSLLGVTAPTVSRMLRSLEELGLLVRRRCSTDARQRIVLLTHEGARIFDRAVHATIGLGLVDFGVNCIVAKKWWSPFTEIDTLASTLAHMRDELFDKAELFYLWHPDD